MLSDLLVRVDWSGIEFKFHSNPLQHMWIEMNPTISKQGLIKKKIHLYIKCKPSFTCSGENIGVWCGRPTMFQWPGACRHVFHVMQTNFQ